MSFMLQYEDLKGCVTLTSLDFDLAEPFTTPLSSVLSSCCNIEKTNMKSFELVN
ncbi:hypothetical protein DPMN_020031 [Dreissena polymorpha]|uniref:Uncharacterized protein n=1 Tax=Dreissena polymorpha TaxID=45954 RepID=A0A9D4NLU8_DREPO|nr:hypothetical protein DPMN_020031 [Dreissena polymorpha]